jgi:hypothetical protein
MPSKAATVALDRKRNPQPENMAQLGDFIATLWGRDQVLGDHMLRYSKADAKLIAKRAYLIGYREAINEGRA